MKFLVTLLFLGVASAAGIVDRNLKHAIHSGASSEAIIELPQIIDDLLTSPTLQSLRGDAKVSALVSTVQEATASAQAPFIALAHSLGLITESFWGSNIILVQGLTEQSLTKLAAFLGTFKLRPQFTASIVNHGEFKLPNATQGEQWNIAQIRAPEAWSVTRGEGCVAGIIDTGVNVGHVALADGYAGGAGAWLDPYYNTAAPTDQQGHGSHGMGTILGRANGVGVAPGAKWIACRGLNHQGSGTEANLVRCGQFMMEANPRPKVINNSWGGGSGDTWYNSIITIWRNAGIVPVFGIGNSGPSCRSANSPGDQPGVISVGCTGRNDVMCPFSSRGPTTTGLTKPDISAPGADITSCGTGSSNYVTMSGTSMSAPHVTGTVCLILSQNPNWTVDQVLERLISTAAHQTLSNADRNCGLPGPGDFPNNAFGAGRVDAGACVGV